MAGRLGIEKVGGLTFRNGELVSTIDIDAELEKRGGLEAMLSHSMKNNALLGRIKRKGEK